MSGKPASRWHVPRLDQADGLVAAVTSSTKAPTIANDDEELKGVTLRPQKRSGSSSMGLSDIFSNPDQADQLYKTWKAQSNTATSQAIMLKSHLRMDLLHAPLPQVRTSTKRQKTMRASRQEMEGQIHNTLGRRPRCLTIHRWPTTTATHRRFTTTDSRSSMLLCDSAS